MESNSSATTQARGRAMKYCKDKRQKSKWSSRRPPFLDALRFEANAAVASFVAFLSLWSVTLLFNIEIQRVSALAQSRASHPATNAGQAFHQSSAFPSSRPHLVRLHSLLHLALSVMPGNVSVKVNEGRKDHKARFVSIRG